MATRNRVEAPEPESVEEPWHIKYRPSNIDDVLGQPEIVKSIRTALTSKSRQHTYFLFGPGGTGKTTLARIMAAGFNCGSVVEVDAASKSGIDDIKAVLESSRYAAFGEKSNKAYIIDECHRLSANAWDALLKITEEPPSHVYFFFASTNPSKIPKPMLTRGPNYALQSVGDDDIYDILRYVCGQEDQDTPDAVLDVVIRASEGSVRQALVMLAMVATCSDAAEAEATLQGVGEIKEVIELCRVMVKGTMRWSDVQTSLKSLPENTQPEAVRIVSTHYIAACLMGAKGERDVDRLLNMLEAFSQPCNQTDKLAPIMIAFGRFVNLGG